MISRVLKCAIFAGCQQALIRSLTDRPFGVGFITHHIETDRTNFEIVVEEQVPVVVFSFTDPRPWLSLAKDAGAVTVCQVQSVELAELALRWVLIGMPH